MLFSDCGFSERPFEGLQETSVSLYGAGSLRTNAQYKIFAGSTEFVTRSTDTLPTTPFFGTLLQPIQFTRSLLGSDIIGNFTSGTGKLQLTNTDGEYDFLIQRYAIDGRDITVKIGREGDGYDDFFTLFSGTASDWSVEEDVVDITIVDNGYKLSVPAQNNLYGGTGGIDGTSDLLGKRKPRAFGYVYNVSPPLVIPTSLVYQLNDGPINAVSAVYDRGVALTFGTNYATSTLLIAAAVSAGSYSTCLAEGFIKLGSSPSGTVTVDVQGDKTGGTFNTTTADIVKAIITTSSALEYPDDLYLPSFTLVNVSQPSDVGYWIGPDDTSTVADVASQLMGGIGGWAGFRRSGKLEVGIFLTPTGVTPAAFFDRSDMIEMKRERLPSALSPPPFRFRVGYQHNYTVQTNTAGSVTAARKSFLAEPDRYANSQDTTIKTDHPFAQDRDPVRSFFKNKADAQTEANRLVTLYKGSRALYRFTVGTEGFGMDLGDVVSVTYPRWDLTVGRKLRIVEISENAQSNTVELVGYG